MSTIANVETINEVRYNGHGSDGKVLGAIDLPEEEETTSEKSWEAHRTQIKAMQNELVDAPQPEFGLETAPIPLEECNFESSYKTYPLFHGRTGATDTEPVMVTLNLLDMWLDSHTMES